MSITNYLKDSIVRKFIKIEYGRAKMFGKIDYIMFPASAMAELFNKVGKDMGEDYLFKLGYEAGLDGANEMIEKLGLLANSVPINLDVINTMFKTLGFGKMDIKVLNVPEDKGLFDLTNHPVIEYARKKYPNKSRVCALYRGIFSVHAEKELKLKNCRFIETQCRLKGDKFCEWSYNYFKKADTKVKKK